MNCFLHFPTETAQRLYIDRWKVIVFIRATDHVITMLCHVTKIVDGKNISGSIDANWFKPNFTWKTNHFWLVFDRKIYLVF